MHLSILNGRNAEFVDIEVQAVDGAGSFTQNYPVHLAVDGNTANGIAELEEFAGVRGAIAKASTPKVEA